MSIDTLCGKTALDFVSRTLIVVGGVRYQPRNRVFFMSLQIPTGDGEADRQVRALVIQKFRLLVSYIFHGVYDTTQEAMRLSAMLS